MLLQKARHRFAPPRAFRAQQDFAAEGSLKARQRRQRLVRLAVHGHVRQSALRIRLRPYLRIAFQAACKLVGQQIQRLRRQRRIARVALRHRVPRFHLVPKTVRVGVRIVRADDNCVFPNIIKQIRAAVFKKQRQVIFHARAELSLAHGLVHGRLVRVAWDFFAETVAEDFLRVRIGGKLVRGQQADFGHGRERALRVRVEGFDAVDFIVKQINAVGQIRAHGEQIDNPAAHGKFARRHHVGHGGITRFHQIFAQPVQIQRLPRFQPKRAPHQERRRCKPLHGGCNGHKQHVCRTVFQLPQHGKPLGHQILMRRKTLVRQRFPIGQEQRVVLRAEELPCGLQAQGGFAVGGEHDFRRALRQVLRQHQRQAAGGKGGPNGFLFCGGDGVVHGMCWREWSWQKVQAAFVLRLY